MINIDTLIRVRYKETDQMGVAHHSNYYPWFEVGRTEFIRQAGLSYSDMENMGLMLPVLETHCFYKHGAKYDDLLIIRTRLSELKGAKLTMQYEVIRENDGLLLAHGSTVHACTDRNMKPLNIRKSHPEIYDLFIKLLG